eukprot:gene59483-81414_t
MIDRRTVLATGLALAARPALALDPGVASGRYQRESELVTVAHAVALSLDNVEDPSPRKREMRVLLSDREAPAGAIMGLFFPPVWRLARTGALRALLLTFDPDDRTGLNVVVLSKRDDGYSPPSISITNTAGLWSRLDISATRIFGDLKDDASENMSFRFSAPSVRLAERDRLAVADEREPTDLDVEAGLPRLFLGQADGSDLRMAIGAARNHRLVHRMRMLAGDRLDTDDALVL